MPRVGRRGIIIITIAVVWISAFVGSLYAEHTASNRCLSDPPGSNKPGMLRQVEWEWTPPGYVCVYMDKRGRAVGRERVLG